MFNKDEFGEHFIRDLEHIGIVADIEFPKVPKTKVYRMTVIADGFSQMNYADRQSLVWSIVEKNLTALDSLHLLAIITRTQDA